MVICAAIQGRVEGAEAPAPGSVLHPHSGASARAAEPLAALDPVSTPADTTVYGLEPFVPGLRGRTFALQPGPRPFLRKLALSPGAGRLGDEPLYLLRLAYNPNEWLGWEAHVAHNRGKTVHALFHMLNGIVRYPLPSRFQPYLVGGFGVVLVFPGNALNADPVTKNALAAGGGLEVYLRDDLAVRGEWRRTSVFGRDAYTGNSAVYAYDEMTLGFSFYRRIGD